MFWVGVTTFVLFTVTALIAFGLPFSWVFLITILGQILVAVMVYKVLKIAFFTDQTFEQLYADRPVNYRK